MLAGADERSIRVKNDSELSEDACNRACNGEVDRKVQSDLQIAQSLAIPFGVQWVAGPNESINETLEVVDDDSGDEDDCCQVSSTDMTDQGRDAESEGDEGKGRKNDCCSRWFSG
jgi:hypothetical protein